jgi:hypothetical protein
LTAANRVYSWANHLNKSGFYPVIVTRNWQDAGQTEKGRLQSSGKEIIVEKNERYEVHYLPYKSNIRDYFFINDYKLLSKLFSLLQIVFQNLFVGLIPFSNLYSYSRKIILGDKDLKLVLISGNPFEQFFFGYKLKKQFPHIHWIADYRDEWTTRIIGIQGMHRYINKYYHSLFEKKWLSNASCFIAAAPSYAATIQRLIKKRSHVVYNGYDEQVFENLPLSIKNHQNKTITFCYLGTIYPEQDFAGMFKKLDAIGVAVKVILAGDRYHDTNTHKNIELECTDRMTYRDSVELASKSDVLLLPSYKGDPGIIPSKLFDYIALKKPVWVFPESSTEIEKTLTDTGQLLRENQLLKILKECSVSDEYGTDHHKQFSRLAQTEKLALIINETIK